MIEQAIKALSAFGELDKKTARKLLKMWAGYPRLTRDQIRTVLNQYV